MSIQRVQNPLLKTQILNFQRKKKEKKKKRTDIEAYNAFVFNEK
jgi:hypothetical protein